MRRPAKTDTRVGESQTMLAGRYQRKKRIGGGGMGQVYAAHDHHTGRQVALKTLKPEIAIDRRARQRFMREGKVCKDLRHPHIVRLLQIVEEQEGRQTELALVFDFVRGVSLNDLIGEQGRLPPARAVLIALQVCDALKYAHARPSPIVHRDIKPSNIMVERDDYAWVLDFGIARVAQDTMMTTTGEALCTPPYAAPEQQEWREMDGRTDIFAFGATLYDMLTGQRPFGDTGPVEAKKQKKYEPVRKRCPDVPEALERLVHKCLEPEPDDRFESAEELEDALSKLVGPFKLRRRLNAIERKAEEVAQRLAQEEDAPDDVTVEAGGELLAAARELYDKGEVKAALAVTDNIISSGSWEAPAALLFKVEHLPNMGELDGADDAVRRLEEEYPASPSTAAAQRMTYEHYCSLAGGPPEKAKVDLLGEDTARARHRLSTLRTFIERHPQSPYVAEAQAQAGQAEDGLADAYPEAFERLVASAAEELSVHDFDAARAAVDRARRLLTAAASDGLNALPHGSRQLKQLCGEIDSAEAKYRKKQASAIAKAKPPEHRPPPKATPRRPQAKAAWSRPASRAWLVVPLVGAFAVAAVLGLAVWALIKGRQPQQRRPSLAHAAETRPSSSTNTQRQERSVAGPTRGRAAQSSGAAARAVVNDVSYGHLKASTMASKMKGHSSCFLNIYVKKPGERIAQRVFAHGQTAPSSLCSFRGKKVTLPIQRLKTGRYAVYLAGAFSRQFDAFASDITHKNLYTYCFFFSRDVIINILPGQVTEVAFGPSDMFFSKQNFESQTAMDKGLLNAYHLQGSPCRSE